ncbi:MAG: transcription elongation factor GreB [Deltaproteobacteria bacterium]|nr:MAG: transcription elongation factor GreB [Deltaproteobacteria bacterium]
MADFKNYITPRGFKRLRDEQRWLRLVERPKIVDEVAYAASLGDRSENAEYIYGKKRLREIDRRLRWLDKRISAAEVVDPSADRGEVVYFGATVLLGYPDGSEKLLDLVGEDEIESDKGRISWRSPIGKALMRRREGDYITLSHLGAKTEIEIVEVSYRGQDVDPPSRWDLARAQAAAGG